MLAFRIVSLLRPALDSPRAVETLPMRTCSIVPPLSLRGSSLCAEVEGGQREGGCLLAVGCRCAQSNRQQLLLSTHCGGVGSCLLVQPSTLLLHTGGCLSVCNRERERERETERERKYLCWHFEPSLCCSFVVPRSADTGGAVAAVPSHTHSSHTHSSHTHTSHTHSSHTHSSHTHTTATHTSHTHTTATAQPPTLSATHPPIHPPSFSVAGPFFCASTFRKQKIVHSRTKRLHRKG
jgi:hypothetical protein